MNWNKKIWSIQKNDKIGILLSNLEFLLLTCKQPQNGVHVKVEIALQRGPGWKIWLVQNKIHSILIRPETLSRRGPRRSWITWPLVIMGCTKTRFAKSDFIDPKKIGRSLKIPENWYRIRESGIVDLLWGNKDKKGEGPPGQSNFKEGWVSFEKTVTRSREVLVPVLGITTIFIQGLQKEREPPCAVGY